MNKEQLLKEIISGKYKNQYLIYTRKSTDDSDSQKNSLSFQKDECKTYASRNKLSIADLDIESLMSSGCISEKHSAFKQGEEFEITEDGQMVTKIERPKFQRLAYFLNQGYFKGVIFYCWDRASRNESDGMMVKKLIKQKVHVRFVTTEYGDNSAGALHMDIDDMFSIHHSRVTREKVTDTTKKLRSKGKVTYKAPIGYLNEGNPDWKPLDPERAPIITESFRLYATGEWTMTSLAKWCNEQGLTTVPMRRKRTKEEMLAEESDEVEIKPIARPVTFQNVSKWLQSRFYVGMSLDENGQWQKSNAHDALIDQETFDKVQTIRDKKTISKHYTETLDHPYRGMVRCAECERAGTPYPKKGIMYFGIKCKEGCSNSSKSINISFIEDKLGHALQGLYFTDDEAEQMDSEIKADIKQLEEKREKEFAQLERKKKAIRDKLKYLRTDKLNLLSTGTYTLEDYLSEETQLNLDLQSLQTEEQVSDEAMSETVKDILKLSELLKNVCFYWEHMTSGEKESLARIIFSELTVMEKTLTYQCTEGFLPFQERLFADCDPTENRTPISRMKTWRPSR